MRPESCDGVLRFHPSVSHWVTEGWTHETNQKKACQEPFFRFLLLWLVVALDFRLTFCCLNELEDRFSSSDPLSSLSESETNHKKKRNSTNLTLETVCRDTASRRKTDRWTWMSATVISVSGQRWIIYLDLRKLLWTRPLKSCDPGCCCAPSWLSRDQTLWMR